ncbi:MAG: hypothetical protein HKN51_14795, partial [Saprospiraceae bacterium]|nr:hypothetical protein [Saprospiraceae bacterium]
MKTLNQILFFTLFMGFAAFGQQESEIKSDGIVFPRLTTYPASPTLGQVIYYDTNTRFEYWDGASWQAFTSGGGTADLIEDGVDNDTYVKAIENGATDKIEIDVEGENPVTIYNDQLFINRTANLSTTEAFGIRKEVTSAAFGGMFMETNGDPSSKPYYGFGINGIVHSWIYHDGASDEVRIYNSGERLSLSNTGFLKINNVYTLPNVDGTPNQYLQTNGNGTASWADAPVSNLIEDSDGDTKVEAINGASDYINMEVEGATGSLEIKSVGSGDIAIEFLNSTNSDNIIIGEGAGEDIGTSANNNIFIGTIAGNKTTTGDDNIYIGRSAGALNILGTRNTFVGRRAGYQNTENDNTFIGNRAGTNSMNSRESVFVGSSAGETAEGINNTAIGFEAAELIDLGEDNVFLGHLTGKNSSDGDENVGIGAQSLFNVGDGSENVALGYSALKNTGSSGATSLTASGNVGAGFEAGLNNDSGYDNTFIGFRSGYNNTTGNNNVYNGYQSGYTNTTALYNVMIGSGTGRNASGSYNSYLGHDAGRNNDGDNNVFLGHEAGMNAPNVSNTLVISNDKDKELIYGEFNNDKVGINSTTMNAHLHIKQTSAGTNTITFENDASGGN